MNILVINGPNINMLGIREPEIYGKTTYEELLGAIARHCESAGMNVTCLQSNHEGDLVDFIQQAYGAQDGIVINPGAYTHTSIAVADALKAVGLPCVEVHLSKISEREDFRRISFVRPLCISFIEGEGVNGYLRAIDTLKEHLVKKDKNESDN